MLDCPCLIQIMVKEKRLTREVGGGAKRDEKIQYMSQREGMRVELMWVKCRKKEVEHTD